MTMEYNTSPKDTRATIKVCLRDSCCQKGAQNVLTALKQGLAREEALIIASPRCLSSCANGPNIAVNDNIMKGVRPVTVVQHVREELENPSCKADGIGSRSLDDLDAVLDDVLTLDKAKNQ